MPLFTLNAQEVKESKTTSTNEITFSLENKSENQVPKLIVNRESIFETIIPSSLYDGI